MGMPEEAEAGDVRNGVRRERSQHSRSVCVQGGHRLDRAREVLARHEPLSVRGEHEARAERLRQEEHVAGTGTRLRPDAGRVDRADDREAVFRLLVANRVTACENRTCISHLLGGGGEHIGHDSRRQLLGESRDREREQRRAAHRKDIVERVRRRDPPEDRRIVHERREEVERENERTLVVELVHRRVVGG